MSAPERLTEGLIRAGVEVAASLPDRWLAPLIEELDRRGEIRHVRVSREDEGVGLCAGAFLAGSLGALVCQNGGLLLSVNALAGFAHHHHVPILVLAAHRGRWGDPYEYQAYKGRVTEGVLGALDVSYRVVDALEDPDLLPAAARTARARQEPVVILLTAGALGVDLSEGGRS